MGTEPLHLVDPEDPETPTDLPPAPPGLVRCQECTILIGTGHIEREPFLHPRGQGAVCGACLESLERRARRRPPPKQAPQSLVRLPRTSSPIGRYENGGAICEDLYLAAAARRQ
jgi:hypothetical protein